MYRPVLFLLLTSVLSAYAAQLPLTVKDLSLMLRAGYSNAAVTQELSTRHFADTLDVGKEGALLKAGATPELLAALKSGTYSVSAAEAAQVQEQLARQTVRSSLAAERSRKTDELYQAQMARERRAKTSGATGTNVLYDALKGDLVRCNSGSVGHADDDAIASKKLIAIYFSAHWCPPCRKFTPELVAYYNRVAPQHPEFEIVFYSADRSATAMQDYMRETNMPWPAIDYEKLPTKEAIRKYTGKGIPCLVLVDQTGKVVSDSYAGDQYLGPQKVLADLDSIFAGAGQVAQRR
jgi:nucleoredoxin